MKGWWLGVWWAGAAWAGNPASGQGSGRGRDEPSLVFGVADRTVSEASVGLRALMPPWLAERSLFGLERWQWLGIPVLTVLCAVLALLVSHLSVRLLRRLARRSKTTIDDEIAARLVGPARMLWFALLSRVALKLLSLPPSAEGWGARLLGIVLNLGFFWALARAVTTWSARYLSSERAAARPGSKALVGLVSRVIQLVVLALAVLATVSGLGFSVTSVLAGLGIGGLALALGAQKTLENLFGAFALALDQPIREGDFVKVEDFVGTVENIGLRSTRIRTLDRTLITVPNSKLADLRLETFAVRDRYRLSATLGLTYGTTRAQMVQVRDGLERSLRGHPKIWPDAVSVRFVGFGESSLDVEVMCWFLVKDYDEFKLVREQVLLDFMGVVEAAGAEFAFPTRTVHLAQGGPPPVHKASERGA